MILAVAENQVQVPVAVGVELKDALQHAGPRDIEIAAAVAHGAAAECLEPAGHEGALIRADERFAVPVHCLLNPKALTPAGV